MSLIQLLRQLQAVDREWDEKSRLYQAARQRLVDQTPLEAQREAQRLREEGLVKTRSALRDTELELAGLQAKAKEVQTDLYGGRIRAPKELESLRQDGEHLARRIAMLEDRALIAMTETDDLEAAVRRGAEALVAFEQEWSRERETLAAQYKALQARLPQLQAAREQLRAALGRAELALYDALRGKKAGIALAPMKDSVCQTCRVSVPSSKAQAVEAGETVITCEGCGRILYHR